MCMFVWRVCGMYNVCVCGVCVWFAVCVCGMCVCGVCVCLCTEEESSTLDPFPVHFT